LRRLSSALAISLALAASLGVACGQAVKATGADDPEVKLGRENAEEAAKELKFVTDPAVVDRVNRIGQEIAAVANSTEVPALWGSPTVKKFDYTFKVVDDKDVNAFSLPGGYIYVNRGLLDFAQSDDELAGVLAHEIAHAAHHHMMKLIKEQESLQKKLLLPLVLAAVVASRGSGGGENIMNLMMAGQLYMVAKLNSYGVEAEKDADQTGMRYLAKTKYKPVGMLTFMERLARQEVLRPQVELGIYRTHPPSPERARALQDEMEQMGLAMDRRDVDGSLAASVTTATLNGVPMAEVRMSKSVVARFAAADGMSAEERGRQLAARLNGLFDQGLEIYEVKLSNDKTRVLARGQTVVAFTQADADPQRQTVEALASASLEVIRNLIWQDRVNRMPMRVGDGA
jgi:predicted Zn-dependent protease